MNKELKKQLYSSFPKMKRFNGIIIGIILCLIGLVMIIAPAFMYDDEPETFDPTITTQNYVNVEAYALTDDFASRGEEDYYFVMDGYGYDVVIMIERDLNSAEKALNDYTYMELDFADPVTFTGVAKKMPQELKDMLVESYNDFWVVDYADETNIEELVGVMYMEVGSTPYEESPLFNFGMVILIFGIGLLFVLIILNIVAVSTTSKQFKKLSEAEAYTLQRELSTGGMINSVRVVFTENFFIAENSGLRIYKYSDVVWLYNHVQRVNFVPSQKSLMMGDVNGKVRAIVSGAAMGKGAGQIDDIIHEICRHNPRIMVGYSNENIQAYKQYKNSLKR